MGGILWKRRKVGRKEEEEGGSGKTCLSYQEISKRKKEEGRRRRRDTKYQANIRQELDRYMAACAQMQISGGFCACAPAHQAFDMRGASGRSPGGGRLRQTWGGG